MPQPPDGLPQGATYLINFILRRGKSDFSCGGGGVEGRVRGLQYSPQSWAGGRDVLEGGAGGGGGRAWLGPPSSLGPRMVPAEGGPKILKLKSS